MNINLDEKWTPQKFDKMTKKLYDNIDLMWKISKRIKVIALHNIKKYGKSYIINEAKKERSIIIEFMFHDSTLDTFIRYDILKPLNINTDEFVDKLFIIYFSKNNRLNEIRCPYDYSDHSNIHDAYGIRPRVLAQHFFSGHYESVFKLKSAFKYCKANLNLLIVDTIKCMNETGYWSNEPKQYDEIINKIIKGINIYNKNNRKNPKFDIKVFDTFEPHFKPLKNRILNKIKNET